MGYQTEIGRKIVIKRISKWFLLTYTESVYIIKVDTYTESVYRRCKMKDLEYIVNGIIVEDESKAEQDEARKKRMLASAFVMVRNKTGMNRKEFAAWLGIPYRTMQDWELGNSQVPEYVLRLVAYKVMIEKERGNI